MRTVYVPKVSDALLSFPSHRKEHEMLHGKSAVITGSTSGIGLGIARALAAQGCAVMLNGLGDPAAIERIRSALAHEHSVEVAYHGADLRQPDAIANLIATAAAQFGSVDILVN